GVRPPSPGSRPLGDRRLHPRPPAFAARPGGAPDHRRARGSAGGGEVSTHPPVEIPRDELELGPGAARWARIGALVGVIGSVASVGLAAAGVGGGWDRFYDGWLVNYLFFLSLALGALVFVLIQHATRAGWSVAVRRLAEGFAPNVLVPMAFLAIPIWI